MQEGLYISICLLISVCGGNSVKSEKKKSNCSSKISHFPYPHSTKEDDLSTYPCFDDGQNDFVATENDFLFFLRKTTERKRTTASTTDYSFSLRMVNKTKMLINDYMLMHTLQKC